MDDDMPGHGHNDPTGSEPASPSRPNWRRLLTGLLAVVAMALLVVALRGWASSEEVLVTVEPGTAERLAQGEQVELLPRTLEVAVGDRLEIVNRDEVTHEVGPYTVAPGQTLTQTFTSPGTLEGACTLHPEGAITIVVR